MTNQNAIEKFLNTDTLNCSVDGNLNVSGTQYLNYSLNGFGESSGTETMSCWRYWQDFYYPQTIIHSYPVYLQDRAKDSGKQAFEIIKALQDKKLIKLEKVSDFIEAMDTLIKIL